MSTLPFTSPPDPFDQRRFVAPTTSASTPSSGAPSNRDVPEGLDPALIQQTKKELRQIVQEITQLSQSAIAQDQFYEEFLRRVVSALAADGGAVWTEGEEGNLELQYQIRYPQESLVRDPLGQTRHGLLLRNVFQSGQPTLVPPQSGGASEAEAGNATEYLLILATLKVEQRTVGVVEIFQRAGGGPTTQRGYLRFLVQMTELAGDYLKNRRLQHLGDRQMLWDSLERFLRDVYRGLDLSATSYKIVNDSRPLIQCDRVSLVLREGRHFTVRAVSGLDNFDRRANEVKLLGRLATVVCATGKPLWYTNESRDIAPQIETPLHQYLDQSHARLVAVIPLDPTAEDSATRDGTAETRRKKSLPIGALVIEKLADDRQGAGFGDRVEAVARHSAAALANALEHDGLFLLPVWKALGKATWIVRARTLPKTLAVVSVLVAVVFGLVLIPADFDLASRGKLQPSIRRDVFAQIDGVVVDVPVRHEQMVKPNEILARLTNNELEIQIENLIGRKRATLERMGSLQRSQLTNRRLEDRNRLDGELLELRQVAESIDSELELLLQKQEKLIVRSDMQGQVVTWNVHDVLLRRPVDKGQVLMTVVDPSGPWELELQMPERRMGHVSRAAHEFSEGLAVKFLLASHPGQEFAGHVVEVHRTAEVHGDEGNAVVLRVAINKEELPELRSDTTVTARVHCGRRGIGYVWFHEVLETIQTKVMFWL